MLFNIIFFTMFFWVFIDLMPGLESPNGAIGNLIAGVLFALVYTSLPGILKFFKFPVNFWGKLLIGTLLTMLLLFVLNAVLPQILTIGEGYVGGGNFIFFTLPKLFSLPSGFAVLVFSSIASIFCSIILEKYGR